jgi:hypothetical protein
VTLALFIAGLLVAAFGVPSMWERAMVAVRWARQLPGRVSIDVRRAGMWTPGEVVLEIRPSPAALRRADIEVGVPSTPARPFIPRLHDSDAVPPGPRPRAVLD